MENSLHEATPVCPLLYADSLECSECASLPYTAKKSQYRIGPKCPSGPIRGRCAEQIDIEGRGISIQEGAS